MKLNSMNPAKIKSRLSPSEKCAESDARNRPTAQPRKPNTCSEIRAHDVRERDGEDDADEQQGRGQRRALGRVDILQDHVGDAAHMVGCGAERGGEDGRRENADAVGSEILQEPRHRRQDGRAPVFAD